MSLIIDVRDSFLRMPIWVAVWISAILLPVNVVALAFLGQPYGVLVAVLAIGGLLPNAALLMRDRAFTSTMGVPHVAVWVPLVAVVLFLLLTEAGGLSTAFVVYLCVLLVADGLSLIADVADTARWIRGETTTY